MCVRKWAKVRSTIFWGQPHRCNLQATFLRTSFGYVASPLLAKLALLNDRHTTPHVGPDYVRQPWIRQPAVTYIYIYIYIYYTEKINIKKGTASKTKTISEEGKKRSKHKKKITEDNKQPKSERNGGKN